MKIILKRWLGETVLILNFNIKCYPQRHYCFVIILSLIFILDYVKTGFLYLQYEVDRAIIKQKSRKANFFDDINVKILKLRIETGNKYNMLAKSHMYIPIYK
jgi:hypothetical protein